MAIRAYIESYQLAFLSRNNGVLYPGFLDATPANIPEHSGVPVEWSHIRPDPQPPKEDTPLGAAPTEFFGYQATYVLSIEDVNDRYRALICEGRYSVFRKDESRPGKYRSLITLTSTGAPQYGDWQSVRIRKVELTDHDPRVGPGRPTTPSGPQRGPMPAPTVDVFGAWYITAASTYLWGAMGDASAINSPELQQECFERMPDDAEKRKAMYTGFHDQPPAHGDPIPGWPDSKDEG